MIEQINYDRLEVMLSLLELKNKGEKAIQEELGNSSKVNDAKVNNARKCLPSLHFHPLQYHFKTNLLETLWVNTTSGVTLDGIACKIGNFQPFYSKCEKIMIEDLGIQSKYVSFLPFLSLRKKVHLLEEIMKLDLYLNKPKPENTDSSVVVAEKLMDSVKHYIDNAMANPVRAGKCEGLVRKAERLFSEIVYNEKAIHENVDVKVPIIIRKNRWP